VLVSSIAPRFRDWDIGFSYYLIPSVLAAFLLDRDRCIEIDVSAAAILKRFEQISDENVNKK
jgi:hypothetical protein